MNDKDIEYARHIEGMCDTLRFPEEPAGRLKKLAKMLPWQTLAPLLDDMGSPETAPEAMRRAEQATQSPDADGFGALAFLLAAACETRSRYREAGLPDSVFLDTLGCLPRFVKENHDKTGQWSFDRGFWVWRQISGCLFRLGTLEYEYCGAHMEIPLPDGKTLSARTPVLYVHIPSDAALDRISLDESYQSARSFFMLYQKTVCRRHGMPQAVLCSSWLLAPALLKLLDPNSGIRRFASEYDLFAFDDKDEEFYGWLYGKKAPLEQLPQNTSLQRAVKKHLMEGNPIGAGYGILNRKLFV